MMEKERRDGESIYQWGEQVKEYVPVNIIYIDKKPCCH